MSYKSRIERKLAAAFKPERLNVVDESENHRGHAGYRDGGETHFRVQISSLAFAGKSRLDRHRLIHAALVDELSEQIHALAIEARAPGE